MKKSLVLAMAMALGVTASAYAANPFSDVPAGHWAYDSIDKLAAAGVIDGMGDGTYQGDKTMTRYEMAQIVAKAMAKGANVDKLAAEFADELDNLGVRVAKLEKKADNVTIAGKIRYRAMQNARHGDNMDATLRSRLYVTGKVNEDWSYGALLQNIQQVKGDNGEGKGEETVAFKEAYVAGRLFGAQVTAGRFNPVFAEGNVMDQRLDGVMVNYGSKIKVEALYARANEGVDVAADPASIKHDNGKVAAITVSAPVMKNLNMTAGYLTAKDMVDVDNANAKTGKQDVIEVSAAYALDNVTVSGMYLRGKAKGSYDDGSAYKKNGYVFGVDYKGANAAQPGSWGAWAKYYHQPASTIIMHTTDAKVFDEGFKGYGVAVNYALAKNIVAEVAYYDTKDIENSNAKEKRVYADVTFSF